VCRICIEKTKSLGPTYIYIIHSVLLYFQIWSNLITCGWSVNDEDLGGAALACFMAQAGADLNKKNRRGVSPFDLARTDRLKEMLAYYSAQTRYIFNWIQFDQ